MIKKILFSAILFAVISRSFNAQNTAYYVNQQSGNDSNNGLTSGTPFKTLSNIPKTVALNGGVAFEIILIGEFVNNSYYSSGTTKHVYTNIANPFLWNSENTLSFSNFKGELGKYITIKPFNSSTILKGNGSNILRVQNSEYLIFDGLKIEGEVQSIPLSLANDLQFSYLDLSVNEDADATNDIDRYNPTLAQIRERDTDDCITPGCDPSVAGSLPKINDKPLVRASYVDTRGFYLSKVNNIKILNNIVTQMPGGGLRVSEGEDIEIIGNEVSYCSLRSYSGTHGLVVTKATSTRTGDDYRIKILRNKIHHNYNEQYSWAPDKDKITPHIDEGKGISLQRNQTTYETDGTTIKVNWENGRILVANNLTYFNGFSGVHSNDGNRVDFINNTAYFNSYTKSITEDNDGNAATFPTSSNGGNIGISISDGFDCKIINNISVIDSRMSKSAIAVKNNTIASSTATAVTRAAGIPDAEIKNNIIYGTTLQGVTGSINENAATVNIQTNSLKADPLFVDAVNFDFRLKITSPAINSGDDTKAPTTDYNEVSRFGTSDRGALEFDANVTLWSAGSGNNSWTDAGNWSAGIPLNNNTYAINIPTGLPNYPEITSQNTALKDVYIESGATLNILPTGSLTISRDLIQEGTLSIKSDATNNGSFILKGLQKGTGNVNYERYVSNLWHLVASPVDEQNINEFSNLLIKKIETGKPDKYSIATYNNSLDDNLRYVYYTDGAPNDIALAGTFGKGKGYSIRKATSGVFIFSGKINTSSTPIIVQDGVSGAVGNKWNLIGNPSTAFINLNDDADATHNFLTVNAAKLDPARVAVYIWDAVNAKYDIVNHTTSPTLTNFAAPGQAFFVQSIDGGGALNITEEMQSHQTGKGFFKSNTTNPEIKLLISSNNVSKKTEIKYLDNATTGLDPGYDAGTFSASANSFDIYTHLVSNSQGVNFALQCLPNSGYENMIVPVGVNASENTEIKFSISSINLPTDLKVFIEDKEYNSFTRLDEENSEYSINLTKAENGIGRFFLHTSYNTLSLQTNSLKNVSIYTVDRNNLKVVGVQSGITDIRMYNILGEQVLHTNFVAKGLNNIELPNLKVGVYIVNIQSEKSKVYKKIVIK